MRTSGFSWLLSKKSVDSGQRPWHGVGMTNSADLARTGTYRTHYTSHAPERVQILEQVSEGSLRVRFMSDGAEEIVPVSSVTPDA